MNDSENRKSGIWKRRLGFGLAIGIGICNLQGCSSGPATESTKAAETKESKEVPKQRRTPKP